MPRIFIIFLLCMGFLFSCQQSVEKDDFSSMEKKLKNDIKLHPDSSLIKETLIQLYRDSGLYENAISLIDSLLDRDDDNERYWHIRGVLEFENEDTLSADTSFRRAYSLHPNPMDGLYIARLMAHYKNPNCIEFCDQLLKDFGNEYQKEIYIIKGNYFSSISNNISALSYFDSCIRSSYTFMEAYLQKAILLSELNRDEEALDVLKKATTVKNNYDEGYFYMGKCYEKLKDTASATNAYNKALLVNPNMIEADEALKILLQ